MDRARPYACVCPSAPPRAKTTMPTIHLETFIRAPIELCFDLSRSVDVHMASTGHTGERAVAGVTSGMMNLDDEGTWGARHFGVRNRLQCGISNKKGPRP